MTDSDISDRLVTLLAKHLRDVRADTNWAEAALPDLGLDSMVAIELVVDIEDEFGGRFDDDALVRETFATLDSLKAAVDSMVPGS